MTGSGCHLFQMPIEVRSYRAETTQMGNGCYPPTGSGHLQAQAGSKCQFLCNCRAFTLQILRGFSQLSQPTLQFVVPTRPFDFKQVIAFESRFERAMTMFASKGAPPPEGANRPALLNVAKPCRGGSSGSLAKLTRKRMTWLTW